MNDIFISYAREDLERARRLAAALVAQGWSVFWDQTIPPGKTWHEVIGTALQEARCVIVVWSEMSIQKDWVREEAEEGKSRKILVPVLFDKVRPPMGFRSVQAASLVDWDGSLMADGFQQLVSAVAGIIGPPKILGEPPASPPEVETSHAGIPVSPPTPKPAPPPIAKLETSPPPELPEETVQAPRRTVWIAGLTVAIAVVIGVFLMRMESPRAPDSAQQSKPQASSPPSVEPQPREAERVQAPEAEVHGPPTRMKEKREQPPRSFATPYGMARRARRWSRSRRVHLGWEISQAAAILPSDRSIRFASVNPSLLAAMRPRSKSMTGLPRLLVDTYRAILDGDGANGR